MQRVGNAKAASACALALVLFVLWPAAAAAQEQLARLDRGPRFMQPAAGTGVPEEVDVTRVALLRRRVSLNREGATVTQLLQEISRQTGLRFAYNADVLAVDRVVGLRADSITVAAALTEILVDAGVDVLLKSSRQAVLLRRSVSSRVGTVAGRVTDAKTGQGVAGVSVSLQGTVWRSATDDQGEYRIADVAPGTYTLRASRIGYARQSQVVTVSEGQEVAVDLALQAAATELENVVVTGTVVETQQREIPTPISVVTGKEIAQLGVIRVDQLFRGTVPGAVSLDLGVLDPLPKIYVRGGHTLTGGYGSGVIKTYVDGVEIADYTTLAQLDVSRIDHVEIVRGPQASTIYGAGAIAGVMQIFTKRGAFGVAGPQVTAKTSIGSLESQWRDGRTTRHDHSLSLSGSSGTDLSYNLGGSYVSTGEWTPGYHSSNKSLYGSVRKTQGPVTVEVNASYSDHPYSYPYTDAYTVRKIESGEWRPTTGDSIDLATPNYIEFRNLQQIFGVSADFKPTEWWHNHLVVGHDGSHGSNTQTRPRLINPGDTLEPFVDVRHGKLSLAYNTAFVGGLTPTLSGNLTLGIDYWKDDLNTVIGTRRQGVIVGSASFTETPYANTGYFAQAQLGIRDALFLTGGVRVDDNDNFGSDYGTAVAPRAGVAYVHQLGTVTAKVRGSFGRAIKAPEPFQVNARVFPSVEYLGNPALEPESQSGYDAGVEVYVGSRSSIQLTYYNQLVEDLITLVRLSDPGVTPIQYQYQNIAQAKNIGWEFQGSAVISSALRVTGTYSTAKHRIRKLAPAQIGDGAGQFHIGDPITRIPTASGGATLSYSAGRTSASAGVTYIGSFRQTDYVAYYDYLYGGAPYRGSRRAYLMYYPGFAKLNVSVSHDFTHHVGAFLRVDNLTNSQASETLNISAVYGRLTVIGARFNR